MLNVDPSATVPAQSPTQVPATVAVVPLIGGHSLMVSARRAWERVSRLCSTMRPDPGTDWTSQLTTHQQICEELLQELAPIEQRLGKFMRLNASGIRRLARLPILVESATAWWQRMNEARQAILTDLAGQESRRHAGFQALRDLYEANLLMAMSVGAQLARAAAMAADVSEFTDSSGCRVPVICYLEHRKALLQLARRIMNEMATEVECNAGWLAELDPNRPEGIVVRMGELIRATEALEPMAKHLQVAVTAFQKRQDKRVSCLQHLEQRLRDYPQTTVQADVALDLQSRFEETAKTLLAMEASYSLVTVFTALAQWLGELARHRRPELFLGVEALRLGLLLDEVSQDPFCHRRERVALETILESLAAIVTAHPQTLQHIRQRARRQTAQLRITAKTMPLVG